MAHEYVTVKNTEKADTSQLFMLPNLLLSGIEKILNQALKLDPSVSEKLAAVQHKRLLIEIRDWQQTVQLVFTAQHFHLYSVTSDAHSDCMISANIDTLLALKNPAMLTQLIRQDKLDLHGDLNIAQAYSAAFSGLDIDWPEQLARYIGDAPAQQLYVHLTTLQQHGKKAQLQLSSMLTSLCQDELAVTIHPLELEQFKQQNRELKGQVAALEQRISALINKTSTSR
ncbi:SCP2 domain-containing protein [Pseudoalteromonas sp.]|uniref:ubiquinone biosynthesis accessory factor UbiJ n=1 Tax=Pseudoalteromonas sp. TaxID=53249 RepID=UPI003563D237